MYDEYFIKYFGDTRENAQKIYTRGSSHTVTSEVRRSGISFKVFNLVLLANKHARFHRKKKICNYIPCNSMQSVCGGGCITRHQHIKSSSVVMYVYISLKHSFLGANMYFFLDLVLGISGG